MPEWLVEEGIGEERAIRLHRGQIAAARIHWPGRLTAGQIEDAVLTSRARGSVRGTVRFASGEEALVDRLPASASEGAALRCRVTRAAVAERDRRKLARALPTDLPLHPPRSLAEQLGAEGHSVRIVRAFTEGDWDELWLEAWNGLIAFDGGELAFFDTSAMTLVDVDGAGDPRTLALAAIPALVGALARFDIGGNIGVDFPTLQAKDDRKAIDRALDAALAGWPHERTAINGFGFVQMVSRMERPSLLQRVHHSRKGAAARLLLRRAEQITAPGTLLLTMHPAIRAAILPVWEADLARRTGRTIRYESDPKLALEAGFAQAIVA